MFSEMVRLLPELDFMVTLDDVRLFNSRAFSQTDVYATYLENTSKNPVVQGQLWRIKINSTGDVEEIRRLHGSAEDFFQVEVNPEDPSQGWFIRKGFPDGYPYGGRELVRFSDFGETIIPSNVPLGNSSCFRSIGINPGNINHLYLELGGLLRYAIRYSMDGGTTWNATDRKLGDFIPSFKSWTAHDHNLYNLGLPSEKNRETIGQTISFVPGVPNELLFIMPSIGGLMRSIDYGANFETYASGGPNKDLGQIAVAPSDPGRWAIAVYEQGYAVTSNDGLLWLGSNFDYSSELLKLTSDAEAAGDWWTAARTAGGIAYHPVNPDIMVGTWTRQGYIVRSVDGGLNWSYTGYHTPVLNQMDVYWSSVDPNLVYAGTLKSNNEGLNWTDIGKAVISVCSSNPQIIIGVDNLSIPVDRGSLGMYISTDAGESWVNLPDPPAENVPGMNGTKWEVTGLKRKWNCSADALIAIDPDPVHDPTKNSTYRLRILMAGRSGIYEYNAPNRNGSGSESNWQIRKSGLENNPHYNKIEPVPWMGFVLFDPRPGYENVVYAAKQNDDATLNLWSGESNKNHSYPGGENTEPFYMSQDGGITWEKMHGEKFPDAPKAAMIESMTIDATGRLIAATTEGIYLISVAGITAAHLNLACSNINYFNLDVNWESSGDQFDVSEYVVYKDGIQFATTSALVNTANINGLKSGTTYNFSVKAKDASGRFTAVSNSAEATTLLPAGPQLSLAYSNVGINNVDLSWNASGDQSWVSEYVVYQDAIPVATLAASVLVANINGLESSKSYTFTVKAKDASGSVISVSNEQTITTKTPVGPQLSLEYSNIGDHSVDINWVAIGDETWVAGYVIYQDGVQIDTVSASVYTITMNGLESGTTYYFTIKAIDASGNIIAFTEIKAFTTLLSSDANPIKTQEERIILYPNPTSGLVYLKNAVDGDLCLLNLYGQVVYKQYYRSGMSISASGLKEGIYILLLNGTNTLCKLVLIHSK